MEKIIDLSVLYEELKKIEKNMATKEELEQLSETMELLLNNETMGQITSSDEDIAEGRTKEISSVNDI